MCLQSSDKLACILCQDTVVLLTRETSGAVVRAVRMLRCVSSLVHLQFARNWGQGYSLCSPPTNRPSSWKHTLLCWKQGRVTGNKAFILSGPSILSQELCTYDLWKLMSGQTLLPLFECYIYSQRRLERRLEPTCIFM